MAPVCPTATVHGDQVRRSQSAEILDRIVSWAEKQFRELGRRDARDLAIALLAGIQGAALLANTFRDAKIMTRQTRHLEKWIDSLG